MFPNVKANKITIIHNGVDLDKFRFDPENRAAVRNAWGLEDAFVLGHVGRFEYQKNHEYLVDIFAAVKQRVPNAKLFLVGEGSLQEDIRKKVDALGLSDDVIFAGLSREVAKLLSGFDVFVLPSHFEGLPIVGVEAQAAGLPVLFADTITKEAKLTEDSWFLPIGENDVAQWAEKLEALTDAKRGDPYDRLKAGKHPIRVFLRLVFGWSVLSQDGPQRAQGLREVFFRQGRGKEGQAGRMAVEALPEDAETRSFKVFLRAGEGHRETDLQAVFADTALLITEGVPEQLMEAAGLGGGEAADLADLRRKGRSAPFYWRSGRSARSVRGRRPRGLSAAP